MNRTPTAIALAAILAVAPPLAAQPANDQLHAVQQSLLNSEQQLSRSRGSDPNQRPNYDQTLRAVMSGQQTLETMRQRGQDSRAVQDAERELAAARRLLESDNADLGRVVNQLRTAANAITAINTGATGPATNPGPAVGGGQPSR